jgi:hypothetical protein
VHRSLDRDAGALIVRLTKSERMRLGTSVLAALLLGCGSDDEPARRRQPASSAAGGTVSPAAPSGAGAAAAAGTGSIPKDVPNPSDPVVIQREADANAVLEGSCATASVRSQLVPSSLLFVIDRSGSMSCNPPPLTASPDCEADPRRASADEPSKWEITRDALKAAMAALPVSTRVGISYFSTDDRCGVSSSPSVPIQALAAAQLDLLGSSLDGTEPGGGTPLVGATILAYKHLHDLALRGQSDGNAFVVLLTDGEQSEQCGNPPRCDSAEQCTELLLRTEVPKAAGPGADIRTFVIGAPGSEPARAVLSEMAIQGRTAAQGCDPGSLACHFDMTEGSDFSNALTSALSAISGETTRCELPLPEPQADAGSLDLTQINVVFSPSSGRARVVPQDRRLPCDAGANGWQFSADSTTIRLCGNACAEVRAEPEARLDVVLGCPVQGPS